MNLSLANGHRLIDRDGACGPTLDLERLGGQILSDSESCREWNRLAAIGELEIDLGGQRIAVPTNGVRLLADRLLEFMQGELTLLDKVGVRGRLLSRCGRCCNDYEEDCC